MLAQDLGVNMEASVKKELPKRARAKTKTREPWIRADVVHSDIESKNAIKYKEILCQSLYFLSGENFKDLE